MKEIQYTCTEGNRDSGKIFYIRIMPASKAESWAMRVLLALINAGVDIPENDAAGGVGSLAQVGLRAIAGLRYEIAQPLLDELMECVVVKPDPKNNVFYRTLIEEDIEEVSTRILLKKFILESHFSFYDTGDLFKK